MTSSLPLIDWRGYGENDGMPADAHYTNYTMQQYAEDMLAALDTLNISFCHLATHSTGGSSWRACHGDRRHVSRKTGPGETGSAHQEL